MKNNISALYQQHSFRLKGFDYTSEGLYFITSCTKDRRHYFGMVSNGAMILNETGAVAELFLGEISTHYRQAFVAEHVVMPNHVHLILVHHGNREIGQDARIAAGPCHGMDPPCDFPQGMAPPSDVPRGTIPSYDFARGLVPPYALSQGMAPPDDLNQFANKFGKPVSGSVSMIINQYKASVKRWCNKNGHGHFQWQPRFYDHIVRNEESYQDIANYILNNPKLWEKDRFYHK